MYFFFFYPVGLDRGARRPPVLSIGLMTVFTVAFLWLHYLPWAFSFNPWKLVFFPGLSAPLTLATAVFMHNGWAHLAGNLIYFWVFAPALESRLGSGRLLLYFLIWGVAGNLAHGFVSAFGLLGQGGLGVMGASGAIAGMMGFSLLRLQGARIEIAWWVLAPLVGQNRVGRNSIPLVVGVLMWFGWQAVQASLAGMTGSTVSFGAHLGGFALGLLMAALLGGNREGRAEALLGRGQGYMRQGAFHAATAEFSQYLELRPRCRDGMLELARTLEVSQLPHEASQLYRSTFSLCLEEGDIGGLLQVFHEWVRQCGPQALEPEEISRVAHYQELQLDHEGTLETYRMLHNTYPDHPLGHRALVRTIVLASGKASDPELAREYLGRAYATLPVGSWRDFLAREFKFPPDTGGGAETAPDPGVLAG